STLIFSIVFSPTTSTDEIYTLSLHDALPICESQSEGLWKRYGTADGPSTALRWTREGKRCRRSSAALTWRLRVAVWATLRDYARSEEHTSELQSRFDLVCRLLLEKKKITLRIVNQPASYTCRLLLASPSN